MPTADISSALKFALTLHGNPAGFVSSTSGGEPFAALSETLLGTGVTDKRVVGVGYEPITVEIDLPLEKPVSDWIEAFLNRSQQLTSGSISILDESMMERRRLEWDNALVTEVTFPAVDAASNERARLKCVIQPTRTRRVPSTGTRFTATKAKGAALLSNFRFTIAGLENLAAHVSRIEPMVVRQPVSMVDGVLKAGIVGIPAVSFLLAANFAEPIFSWFDNFVGKPQSAGADERNGSLLFLDSRLQDVLLGLSLKNLGVVRINELREVTGVPPVERLRVALYCEQMQLSPATKSVVPG